VISSVHLRAERAHAWLNLLAQSAVIVAFAMIQNPRWTAPDTKLDLTVNPGALLTRAFTLWDPQAAAGQLQNQAYGYLFPMGPFFWLGHAIGLPPWIIQRLWWALLLLVGYHGMRLVLRRLDIGTQWSRIVAAFAFAFAPRMLEGLGAVSSEIWPMALAPWVLLPVLAVPAGGERRAAARSAVAFLCAGAVNAVATLALLPLPALWIMTRRHGRVRLLRWWAACIALASLWWMVPLVLLGRYSPPFLDWIESSAVTTSVASTTEALRGTTQWIAAILGARGPQWPAGWDILTLAPVVGLGLALVAIGLAGVWVADTRWRLFARAGLATGLLLVTLGHVSSGVGPQAKLFAELLDGALSPFRNTHKFEPIIRVVLCLGVAHALPLLTKALRGVGSRFPQVATVVAVLAIAAQLAPPVFQGVSQRGEYLAVPDYWSQAADWLGSNPSPGRTLVLPGASAPASYWGDPRDEPMQPLASSPWMVRDAVPLGSGSATRMLNDIEARVASGYGGAELRAELARLGISRVLQRSDLNYRVTGAPGPMVVEAALLSVGAKPVQAFGPLVGGSTNAALAVDGGRDEPTPAIVVYDLPAASSRTTVVPASLTTLGPTTVVSGGPEAAALSPAGPSVLSSDQASVKASGRSGAPEVLTDTLQRREANFAAVRQNYGPVLPATEPYAGQRRVHDWLPAWLPEDSSLSRSQTTEVLVGASSVSASSSMASPGLGQARDLTRVPDSAFDASAETMWESSGLNPAGQSISVTWPTEVTVPGAVSALFDMKDGADVGAVTITTDRGSARTPLSSPGAAGVDGSRYAVTLQAPAGPTRHLRLTVDAVRPGKPTVRLRDLGVGTLPRVESWLQLPAPTSTSVSGVLMQASPSRVPACVPDAWGVPHCVPDQARGAEGEGDLRRVFTLPAGATFTATGTVVPRDDAATRRLLARVDGIRASASSSWMPGAQTAPELLVDGSDRTYWAAAPSDNHPTITLRFPSARKLSGLLLTTYDSVTGRRPTAVEVTVGGRTYSREVAPDGSVRIPEVRTRTVAITVTDSTRLAFRAAFSTTPAPIVLGDIALIGDAWQALEQSQVAVPCGFGPRLQVNGTEYATRVSGSRTALVNGQPLRLEACGKLRLGTGTQRLRLLASTEFGVRTLSLGAASLSGASGPSAQTDGPAVEVTSWSATARSLKITGPGPQRLLTVRENANTGWQATLNGHRLTPVTADGWAQAWVVPAGATGTVALTFSPQTPFRVALFLGLLTAVAVLLLAAGLGLPGSRRRRWLDRVSRTRWGSRLLALRERPAAAAPTAAAAGDVVPETPVPDIVLAALVVLVGILLSGWWGLGAALVALVVRRFGTLATAVALAATALLWVLWSASAPWPHPAVTNRGLASQVLAALVVVMVMLPLGPRHERRRPWQKVTTRAAAEPQAEQDHAVAEVASR
jgi:arabinofuranan 3-O-arabinosyltransferase